MAGQTGVSLSAVAKNGSYTGAAVTPTANFAHASMVVTVAGYATSQVGESDSIEVALQASHDGTNWVTIGAVATESAAPAFVTVTGFPGAQLRAVIINWGANVTAGAVTASVFGV